MAHPAQEERSVEFTDAKGRQVQFQLSRRGSLNVMVNGQQKMACVKKLFAENRTIFLDGKKIMSSASDVTVPKGKEELVMQVMELFGQRNLGMNQKPADGLAQLRTLASSDSNCRPLCVVIQSARGLRQADFFTKSDPYCTCEVIGKPGSKFTTRTINRTLTPTWNHVAEIATFKEGDSLFFNVWDKDYFSSHDQLGHVTLKVDEMVLPYFEGELPLEDCGQFNEAFLKVRLTVGTAADRIAHQALSKVFEASRGDDLDAFAAAIRDAKHAGAQPHDLQKAEQELAARTRLREAQTPEELIEALRHAREVRLPEFHVDRAHSRLRGEVCQRLQAACESRQISELEAAIKLAELAQLDPSDTSPASAALAEEHRKGQQERDKESVKEEEQRAEEERQRLLTIVRQRLEEAQEAGSIEELERAIAEGKQAGLGNPELKRSEQRLRELRDEKGLQERERYLASARQRLEDAQEAGSIEELEHAIAEGKQAGLGAPELERAEQRLQELRDGSTEEGRKRKHIAEVRRRLEEICKSDSASAAEVQEAIRACLATGLDRQSPLIERAQGAVLAAKHREVLKPVAEVVQKFRKAMQDKSLLSGDVDYMTQARDELREVIGAARELQCSDTDILVEAEKLRKQLHNKIMDLKGKVRVICRARPLSKKEKAQGDIAVVRRYDFMSLEVTEEARKGVETGLSPKSSSPRVERRFFTFNSTFAPGTQEEVFLDTVDLIQSALDGYNVTLFAYGQTGAGKTYTLFGERNCLGVAPRTIDELFDAISRNSEYNEFKVSASVLELYCNEVVDLLQKSPATLRKPSQRPASPSSGNRGRNRSRSLAARTEASRSSSGSSEGDMRGRASSASQATPRRRSEGLMTPKSSRKTLHRGTTRDLAIRHDPITGAVVMENLSWETCDCPAQLHSILERGNKQRQVAETSMNTDSSRSHLILFVRIVIRDKSTGKETVSKVVLVDLAGSERLKKSQATGQHAKEATEINKSLSALGDVIQALTEGSEHVPYRNHKLTTILQDALGGSAKTLMFVNCSPASSNIDETLLSLRWAQRVNNIKRKSPPKDAPTKDAFALKDSLAS